MLLLIDDRLNLSMIKIGQIIPPLTVKLEKKTYKQYNKLIKEINPMHLSKIYVQRLGYNDVLIAGICILSHNDIRVSIIPGGLVIVF